MYEHPKYCARCKAKACVQRTDLPTHSIVLKPGYHFANLHMEPDPEYCSVDLYDLKITEVAEYTARPLPHNGLDLIRDHSNDSMMSDRADFRFHEHEFEVYDKVLFSDWNANHVEIQLVTPEKMFSFIGDPDALLTLRSENLGKYKIHVEPGDYFHKVYRNEEHIGFGINESIRAYDVHEDEMTRSDGIYSMAVAKYTDKATRKADGILFAGSQNANWMNFKLGVLEECQGCVKCDRLNDRDTVDYSDYCDDSSASYGSYSSDVCGWRIYLRQGLFDACHGCEYCDVSNGKTTLLKFEHLTFCDDCESKICVRRTNLPTYSIVLKPGYHFVQLWMERDTKECSIFSFDLKITEEAEYKARPLPHNGLDLIRNHSNESMLSDWADFNFHDHDFELSENIPFSLDDGTATHGVKILTPRKMLSFIGDPVALLTLQKKNQTKYNINIEPGAYFSKVFRNDEHIGYGINENVYAYNVLDMRMNDDDLMFMAVAKYTDKETRKADGIFFGGEQTENWMNYKEGIEQESMGCSKCDEVTGRGDCYWP